MNDTYRILVTGSRNWSRLRLLRNIVDAAAADAKGKRVTLVHGNCPEGADHMVKYIALARGWTVSTFEADWDHCVPDCPTTPEHRRKKRPGDRLHPGKLATYCPGAGPRRNRAMVDSGADVVLAFIRDHSQGATGCAGMAKTSKLTVHAFFDCECHRTLSGGGIG